MKKRLAKKKGNWCNKCNRPLRVRSWLDENDPYIGFYRARGRCAFCPVCKNGWTSYKLGVNQELAFQKKAAELLLKNYPPDKCEYISEEEVFKHERAKPYGKPYVDMIPTDSKLLSRIRYFIFNTFWEGKRIYLKKSFDLYQDNRTGWFDITKPYSESN